MSGMVEKPAPEDAPSNLRIIGRYILQPEIFKLLETQERGAGGEIQLTDSMNTLASQQDFHACICDGPIYDCGSKTGWMQANIKLGIDHPEFGETMRDYIRSLNIT